ncbi:MAG: TIGR03986 family CRISPR-associated RAMP protein, partial [bacterium]|nr:TIGR03986 family CRISPR-associated RAMP protein [bacterium]
MEKAIITKSGKGWKLILANGTSMTINWADIPSDWDNAEILVEREKGQPIILKKGETTMKKPVQIHRSPSQFNDDRRFNPDNNRDRDKHGRSSENPQGTNSNNNMNPNRTAKSPYNFVPLNDIVVYPDKQVVLFDKYEQNRNTGYIDLKIENLTDLMISKGVDLNKTHDFLKIGKDNKPIIPGSSLRGLIKKMVGILSYSKLIEGEHYDDHALFYRGVADKAFTDIYQPAFFDVGDNYNYKPLAGYLTKEGNDYKIYPAGKDSNNVEYYKIRNIGYYVKIDQVTKKPIFEFDGRTYKDYCFEEIYFEPKNKTLHKHYRYNRQSGRKDIPYNLKYALVDTFSLTPEPNLIKGTLVITGGMAKNKHDQWIINLKDTTRKGLIIPQAVVNDYKSDGQRNEEFDLIEKQKQRSFVPCFYLTDAHGAVTSFGHTPLYRIKHSKTIKDAVKQETDDTLFDFEQLIFGNTSNFASRVYFEDAILDKNQNAQSEKILIKILASPKPTSHQLYLKQDNMPLKNWSSDDIEISGTKEYWHKNVDHNQWKDHDGKVTSSHTGYIKPILPHNHFNGRIRFENLTNEELGALLYALDLPQNCCHKIGMGKPLGLGTIRIRIPRLVLDNRKERYSHLLDQDGKFHFPLITDLPVFKKSFSDFMLSKVGNGKIDLWEVERLSQLKAMLKYDDELNATTDWLNETRYMLIQPENEFKNRNVLDTPKSILSKFKKPYQFQFIMLINLSNHPFENWGENQKRTALELFGRVIDKSFPAIDPESDLDYIQNLSESIYEDLIKSFGQSLQVHIMGEFVLTY